MKCPYCGVKNKEWSDDDAMMQHREECNPAAMKAFRSLRMSISMYRIHLHMSLTLEEENEAFKELRVDFWGPEPTKRFKQIVKESEKAQEEYENALC